MVIMTCVSLPHGFERLNHSAQAQGIWLRNEGILTQLTLPARWSQVSVQAYTLVDGGFIYKYAAPPRSAMCCYFSDTSPHSQILVDNVCRCNKFVRERICVQLLIVYQRGYLLTISYTCSLLAGVAYAESNSLNFVDVWIKKRIQWCANVGIACKFMLFSYRISVDKIQLLPQLDQLCFTHIILRITYYLKLKTPKLECVLARML